MHVAIEKPYCQDGYEIKIRNNFLGRRKSPFFGEKTLFVEINTFHGEKVFFLAEIKSFSPLKSPQRVDYLHKE
jgi:hypothetical protein